MSASRTDAGRSARLPNIPTESTVCVGVVYDTRPTLWVYHRSPSFITECRRALSERFNLVTALSARAFVVEPAEHTALFLLESPDATEALPLLAALGRRKVTQPIVTVLRNPSTRAALEAIALGATEVVLWPAEPRVLLRQVVRALTGLAVPVVAVPGCPDPAELDHAAARLGNRRRGYRIRIDDGGATHLRLVHAGRTLRLPLHDLSLGLENVPGGLSAWIPAEALGRAPCSEWSPGDRFSAVLWLDGEPTGIALVVQIVRVERTVPRGRVAGTYHPVQPAGAQRIARYWVRRQRMLRAAQARP